MALEGVEIVQGIGCAEPAGVDQAHEYIAQAGAVLGFVGQSLLGIDQDAVVDEDDEIVLAVTGHVGHGGFVRLREISAAAEGAFLEDLPAVGRHQLVAGVEHNEVKVVPGGL